MKNQVRDPKPCPRDTPMRTPRRHPESKSLDPDAESITELRAILRGRVGRPTLLRHGRVPFIARIDSMLTDHIHFSFTATPLASVQPYQPLLCGASSFPWGYEWEGLVGGRGMVSAPHVSWKMYYDQALIGAVVALVDVAPPESENDEALQLMEDFEHRRHAERPRFSTGELFTDRKLT